MQLEFYGDTEQSQSEAKEDPPKTLDKHALDHPNLVPLLQSISRSTTKFDPLFKNEEVLLQTDERVDERQGAQSGVTLMERMTLEE